MCINGGGVLITVHDSISSSLIKFSTDNENIEFISSCLFIANFKMFITCSYIPPISDVSVYMQHNEMVQKVNNLAASDDIVLVLGDFNISDVSWSYFSDNGYLLPSSLGRLKDFFNSLSELCLSQYNNIFNFNNRLLDFVC